MEGEVQDLLEELDLHKFIHADLQDNRPNDSFAIAEAMDKIHELETQVARLLGEEAPAVTPQTVSTPPVSRVDTPTTSAAAVAANSRHHSSSVAHGHTRPSSNLDASPVRPSTQENADSRSTPQWPSSAPSPFGAASSRTGFPAPTPFDISRKRPRQDSFSSLAPVQTSKRAVLDKTRSRMAQIDENMETQLAQNRQIYASLLGEENVRDVARLDNISEEQAREKIKGDQKDSEQEIRQQFQLERDGEFARMLQAQQDESSDDERGFDRQQLNSTGRANPSTYSASRLMPSSTLNLPDRTHLLSGLPNGFSSLGDLSRSGFDFSSNPPIPRQEDHRAHFTPQGFFDGSFPTPWRMPPISSMDNSNEDDELQEITPDIFNSRFGRPTEFVPTRTLPDGHTHMPGRVLPWMREPDPRARDIYLRDPYMRDSKAVEKAMELVRDQMELDMVEDDFAYSSPSKRKRTHGRILTHYEEADFPQDIKNLITGIKDIREATKADKDDTPSGLKVTLMKHQKIGLAWMKAKEESSHKGGILADDMGLGKTIQAIALMVASPPTDPEQHPVLIVCPKALMDQWRLEIKRHVQPGNDQLSVFIFHGDTRNSPWRVLKTKDVIITTFGTLTANFKLKLKAEKLEKEGKDASLVRKIQEQAVLFLPVSKFHRVIVDEAQNIKNPLAKSTKACSSVNATFRWCLTGTPMMNRLEDFQSLLGYLRIRPYNNKEKFKSTFVRPIKSGGGAGEQAMAQLRVLVKSICFRRTKESKIDGEPILQLPPKVIEQVHVVFSEHEQQMYTRLNANTQDQVTRYLNAGTLGRNYSHVLVLLLRLRQACCHPHLMHGYNAEPATTVEGVNLVANAKLLDKSVVSRIKNNENEDDGTCPICMDTAENAVIYIPCGHSVCTECFARISDPTILARDDESGMIKCQNCRGPVDPTKITDANSFKIAHDPEAAPQDAAAEETEQSSDSDSDDYDSDTSTDGKAQRRKKVSLAELRKAAQKNKREKRKYIRRLEKTWIPSAKIDKATDILQANEDRGQSEKTIIFSQFTSLLDLLEVPINRRGWKYVRFDGSMNIADRNASVAAFTDDPDVRIMLVSLKAGNAGLNLVAASHVILFDPFWNPYVEDQAIDRAHRIGQKREVFVHRLLIEGTVEDRIIELQNKKRELISGALDEGGTFNVSRLDTRELAYLFGVRHD
ncbi:uncharacterized protein N7477_010153 [Penicillium maclennaniae]|uniref:uncharacterized protein n=1 Tax=Penicillium maclennaniae TaxID=1343394 RepID=UPI00253FA471|nr:uncharacterized protein N7477_010153 [Penicillium maclennaniae]KAJ5662537.1 hypothetical protein N7477_010153 [Penicillium maclennaniae]